MSADPGHLFILKLQIRECSPSNASKTSTPYAFAIGWGHTAVTLSKRGKLSMHWIENGKSLGCI